MSRVPGSKGTTLVRWMGLAMALPALLAVVLLAEDATQVIKTINETALKREAAALERGLKLLGEVHASELISQTLRDEAFRNVVLAKRPDWIKEHFGADALANKDVQKFIIVEPDGKVVFSSDAEGPSEPETIAPILAAARRPMERARALYREARASPEGFDERMPGAMVEGIYVNDVVRMGDTSAMVTVSPFAPDDETLATPPDPTLLVGVHFMSEALFDKLASLSHLEGLEQVGANHTEMTGEPVHVVRDSAGNTVAHVTWDFELPSQAILEAALPAFGVSIGLIVLLTLASAITMRRLTRRLAESEQAAIHASRHDPATGLANRGWFMSQFSNLLARSDLSNSRQAVLLIDCDDFKSVNDTLGHAAGDAVLRSIAARLTALDDKVAVAARLGGDEFAAISHLLSGNEDIRPLVADVERALMRPVMFKERAIPVSVSIGATVFAGGTDRHIDEYLAQADLALYRAKRDGRGCGRVYDAALDSGEIPQLPVTRHPERSRTQGAVDLSASTHTLTKIAEAPLTC